MSRNKAYPTKKASTIVVFQVSVHRNSCQRIVCVELIVYAAQQISTKGAYMAHTLSVRSFLQTWPKKKWHITSLVTTVACTRPVLLMTKHLALCLQMPGIRRKNWYHTFDNDDFTIAADSFAVVSVFKTARRRQVEERTRGISAKRTRIRRVPANGYRY